MNVKVKLEVVTVLFISGNDNATVKINLFALNIVVISMTEIKNVDLEDKDANFVKTLIIFVVFVLRVEFTFTNYYYLSNHHCLYSDHYY